MPDSQAKGTQVRELLCQIHGVVAVDIEEGPRGEIRAIDIRVDDPAAAGRVTRDVESALMSGLDLTIDHRIIHVNPNGSGTRRNGRDAPVLEEFPAHSLQVFRLVGQSEREPEARRIRLRGVRCAPDGDRYVEITVEIESRGETYAGRIRDADIARGRLLAAGRATLQAVAGTFGEDTTLVLEGIEEFAVCGDRALLAVVSARVGRDRPVFHGAALLQGDPLEAAARAVLDALNRFQAAQGGAA